MLCQREGESGGRSFLVRGREIRKCGGRRLFVFAPKEGRGLWLRKKKMIRFRFFFWLPLPL
jgi:hypothetical protein